MHPVLPSPASSVNCTVLHVTRAALPFNKQYMLSESAEYTWLFPLPIYYPRRHVWSLNVTIISKGHPGSCLTVISSLIFLVIYSLLLWHENNLKVDEYHLFAYLYCTVPMSREPYFSCYEGGHGSTFPPTGTSTTTWLHRQRAKWKIRGSVSSPLCCSTKDYFVVLTTLFGSDANGSGSRDYSYRPSQLGNTNTTNLTLFLSPPGHTPKLSVYDQLLLTAIYLCVILSVQGNNKSASTAIRHCGLFEP